MICIACEEECLSNLFKERDRLSIQLHISNECVKDLQKEIDKLKAELEASEEVTSYFSNHPDRAHRWPYAQNAIEAWRKSKGEGA